jgi:hypothetical protein
MVGRPPPDLFRTLSEPSSEEEVCNTMLELEQCVLCKNVIIIHLLGQASER